MSSEKEFPRYKCHKIVHALEIKGIFDHEGGGQCLSFADEGFEMLRVEIDIDFMVKHEPRIGNFYVVYEDGYKSISPPGAFTGRGTHAMSPDGCKTQADVDNEMSLRDYFINGKDLLVFDKKLKAHEDDLGAGLYTKPLVRDLIRQAFLSAREADYRGDFYNTAASFLREKGLTDEE